MPNSSSIRPASEFLESLRTELLAQGILLRSIQFHNRWTATVFSLGAFGSGSHEVPGLAIAAAIENLRAPKGRWARATKPASALDSIEVDL